MKKFSDVKNSNDIKKILRERERKDTKKKNWQWKIQFLTLRNCVPTPNFQLSSGHKTGSSIIQKGDKTSRAVTKTLFHIDHLAQEDIDND